MTRCLLRSIITTSGVDSEALYLQNAEVYVFRTGTTTTPVMYAGPTGGSPLTNPILSDGNGEIDVWLDPTEVNIVDIRVDSNGGNAHLAGQPSKRQGFATFTKTLQAGGPQGPPGPNGGGTLIAGGTTSQALIKASGTDYDTTWHTLTASDVGAEGRGAAFFAKLGGGLIVWDSFQRSDRNLLYDIIPSGQKTTGSGVIRSSRYVRPNLSLYGAAGQATFNVQNTLPPGAIGAEWVFVAGTTITNNLIVAAALDTGLADGSVQIGIWPNQWQVFTVHTVSGTAVYTTLATGTFATQLLQDGVTRYRVVGRWDKATSSVALDLPDGTTATVTDASINTYWGPVAIYQHRHPVATDGEMQVTKVAAATTAPAPPPPPPQGSALSLPGNNQNFLSASAPASWTPGDLDIRCLVAATNWASANQALMSQWHNSGGQLSWNLQLGSTGKLIFDCSPDGTTDNQASSSVSVPFANGTFGWCRATYAYASGTVIFYTSVDGTTWTQLGSTRTITSGAPFLTSGDVQIGAKDSSLGFGGLISYAAVMNGIAGTVVSGVDFRGVWTGTGIAGNAWVFNGTGWAWAIIESTVVNLVADLAARPTLHHQVSTSNGTFTVPAGVTVLRVRGIGGGGQGGGGGAAALTGGVTTQMGGGGGAAGCVIDMEAAVTPGDTITHTIGAGGSAAGVGGAASSGSTGNAGTAGSNGATTTVTGPTVSVSAAGGSGAAAGAANSTAAVGGGLSGFAGGVFTSTTNTGQQGSGTPSVTSSRRPSPSWPGGSSGGNGGAPATTTLGGNGGACGLVAAMPATGAASGDNTATTAGGNGVAAATNSGAGGGGGGGGAPGGAGGNGGAGAAGSVTYSWIA